MVEANGTLEPMLDSVKSNGVIVVSASRWPGLAFLLLVVLFLGRLLLSRLLLGRLLLNRLLLGRLLPGRLLLSRPPTSQLPPWPPPSRPLIFPIV
jgi:hypothetical protein